MKELGISEKTQVLFIIFISLGIYYPVIYAEILSIDDFPLINYLINVQHVNLKSLFFPEEVGSYYRPLLYLTFLFDGKFFGAHQSFMHLHNLLIHTSSAILVFFLSREALKFFNIHIHEYFPFFVSLMFTLHPINAEPVCWISGRTDLLAGFFVFLSLVIILKKGFKSYTWTTVASFFYLLGLLSKEVAIGMVPVVVFIILSKKEDFHIRNKLFLLFIFIMVTLFYFYMRSGFDLAHDSGLKNIAHISKRDVPILIQLRGVMKAMGFYFKKVFIPYPLSFAITEISTYVYLPVGIMVTLLGMVLIVRRISFVSFWVLFIISFYLPAVPLVLAKITWTPLAERYLYVSSLGASILTVLVISKVFKEKVYMVLIVMLLVVFGITTYNRVHVWQTNLSLFEDTVKKNPNFAPIRNEYAVALFKKGRKEEAMRQLSIAIKLAKGTPYILPELNKAILEGQSRDELKVLKESLGRKDIKPRLKVQLLERIISIYQKKLISKEEVIDRKQRQEIYENLISYYTELYRLTQKGFYQYRLGQLYLTLGDKRRALESFKEAIRSSPNEYFSPAARKLINHLQLEIEREKIH